MAVLKVYSGSSWVDAIAKTYNGSAWENQMKFHDGSSFVPLYGPMTSAAADGDVNVRELAICFAGVDFLADGLEYEYTPSGGTTFVNRWLDRGANSDVWVERVVTAGSWNSRDPGSGRHLLSSDRKFRCKADVSGTTFTVTGYFKFWDAASGGNLLQQTASVVYSAFWDDLS